jgi:hypothetical protein
MEMTAILPIAPGGPMCVQTHISSIAGMNDIALAITNWCQPAYENDSFAKIPGKRVHGD